MPTYRVTTESVQQAGNRINQLSAQIEDLIGQCRQTATGVSAEWTGTANSAFENAMGEWNSAANSIRQACADIGIATNKAGVNYADTETGNTSLFR